MSLLKRILELGRRLEAEHAEANAAALAVSRAAAAMPPPPPSDSGVICIEQWRRANA